MRWRNTKERYGSTAIMLHWMVALMAFGLFGLGLWMVELGYYDPWYYRGTALHKSIGVVLLLVLLARLAWRLWSPSPEPLASHAGWERHAARLTHWVLYLMLFGLVATGYLISTADGRPMDVFGLVEIPAMEPLLEYQEDVAGDMHRYLAWGMVGLALLHSLAALKHHFIDRDATLQRMLGIRSSSRQSTREQ